jgi:hypothetical protein
MGMIGSLLSLLILIGDIWAVIHIVQSPSTTANKLLWGALIFFLPLIGLIIWYFAGPRKAFA